MTTSYCNYNIQLIKMCSFIRRTRVCTEILPWTCISAGPTELYTTARLHRPHHLPLDVATRNRHIASATDSQWYEVMLNAHRLSDEHTASSTVYACWQCSMNQTFYISTPTYFWFLANVNSSSGSLYVVVRPSVVCRLSVVCNVRAPYSGDWNLRKCFYAIWYLGHPWPFCKNFTEIVPGEPLRRRVKPKRGSKI